MPSYFWSWPLFSPVNFENNISQARDLLAGERNFLIGVRTSFVITVSALSVLFQSRGTLGQTWYDWTLAGILLALSLGFPIVCLVNYSFQFDAYYREVARVYTSSWLLFFLIAVALCDVLVAVRSFYLDGETTS